MREPPKMRLPEAGSLMPEAMRLVKREIEAAMAWMQEACDEMAEAVKQIEQSKGPPRGA